MKKWIFCVLFAVAFLPVNQAQTVDSTRYWMKIKATDKFQRSVLANMGLAIDIAKEDYVIALGNVEEMKRVEKLGWLETSFSMPESMDFPSEDANFHNYEEITAVIRDLASNNPDIVELTSIGKTLENRDIWAVRLSTELPTANQKPGIVFMGGHHAREHLSTEIPMMLAQYLVKEFKAGNERIVSLLRSREIHIIPVVNPDGKTHDIATGRYKMWRKNRRANGNGTYGVDLNRNYSYQWGTTGTSDNPSSDVYRGTAPFSEPETQAIKNFIDTHTNLTILLTFHTFSELILYPWGHKYDSIAEERDLRVHEVMAQTMSKWNNYTPQQSSDLYTASGDTTDWAYATHKIISFTFEMDPKDMWSGGGFYPGQGVIEPVFRKNLEPALYLMSYADNPYRVLETSPQRLDGQSSYLFQ